MFQRRHWVSVSSLRSPLIEKFQGPHELAEVFSRKCEPICDSPSWHEFHDTFLVILVWFGTGGIFLFTGANFFWCNEKQLRFRLGQQLSNLGTACYVSWEAVQMQATTKVQEVSKRSGGVVKPLLALAGWWYSKFKSRLIALLEAEFIKISI